MASSSTFSEAQSQHPFTDFTQRYPTYGAGDEWIEKLVRSCCNNLVDVEVLEIKENGDF